MTLTASARRHEEGDTRGAAAVEFALLLPFLLLIVFGIIEFGFIFNTQISLTQAVREGVRVEALEIEGDDGVSATEASFHPMITDTSGLSPGPVTSCDGNDRAEVQATYDYPFIVFPFMDYAFGSSGTMQLSAKAVMRCGG